MMTSDDWVRVLGPTDGWNERHLMAMFAVFGVPDGYLDIGSGTGAMVNLARKIGVVAYGVDQIERPESYLFQHDLRNPFTLDHIYDRRFDLVSCIEVAEHLPPESDTTVVDTVVRHARRWIVFTTAHPGQEGDDHVGVRPTPHWRRLFWDRGYTYDAIMSARLSLAWLNIQTPHYWLPDNAQVFHK